MPWHYKHPSQHSAIFPSTICLLINDPSTVPIMFSGSYKEVQDIAEKFRYYKWCVRQKPLEADSDIVAFLSAYNVRTKAVNMWQTDVWYLNATATPQWQKNFEKLNPDLAGIENA